MHTDAAYVHLMMATQALCHQHVMNPYALIHRVKGVERIGLKERRKALRQQKQAAVIQHNLNLTAVCVSQSSRVVTRLSVFELAQNDTMCEVKARRNRATGTNNRRPSSLRGSIQHYEHDKPAAIRNSSRKR